MAKINLVDLAGTERTKKIKPEGKSLREVTCINKSLSFLEQTIWALRLSTYDYIPFRQSPLTTILRDSLGGNCKTIMIACAWSEDYLLDETISTCRFAQRVKYLKTVPLLNKKWSTAAVERRYVKQIAELKQELALRDALAGRTNITYDDLTEDQREELKEKINAYLTEEADVDSVPVVNLKQVKELFSLFKEAQLSLRAELEKLLTGFKGDPIMDPPEPEPFPDPSDGDLAVGVLTPFGLDIGLAPASARPESYGEFPGLPDDLLPASREPQFDPAKVPASIWEEGSANRCAAFVEYKHSMVDGQDQDAKMKDKHNEIKQKRRYARNLSSTLNGYKLEIEELKKVLAVRQVEENAVPTESFGQTQRLLDRKQAAVLEASRQVVVEANVQTELITPSTALREFPPVTEETEKIVERYKFLQASYVKDLAELKRAKGEIELLHFELQECRKKLLLSFYRWFETICLFKGQEGDGEFMLSSLADRPPPPEPNPRSPIFTGPPTV